MFFTASTENDRCAWQIRNASGIAVFASDASDKAHWIEVGSCHERFAMQATAVGLGERRPDLIVRFGRGPAMPWSMRRPDQAVLA
jgi:hypothetical protein